MLITYWLVALSITLLVSASIIGWGCLVRRFSQPTASPEVLGLGFLASTSMITGVWGGYTFSVQTVLVLIGLSGLWSYPKYLRELPDVRLPKGRDWLWLAPPALYFLVRAFSCGLPQQHSDPLYYHLAAPKLWAQLQQIRLTPEHPSYAQATLWETLYGIPQIWLGPLGLKSHVITQLYGQWMHMLWGQIGSTLVGAAILQRLVKGLKPGLGFFAAWLCVTQPAFEWLGCLAKNDYILTLFVLAATLEALGKRFLLAGVLIGFAYSTKMLAAWGVLALVVFVPLRDWPRYIAGVALAVSPVLFRNFVWTHNPVFPMLDASFGPHWISSWWNEHNRSYGGPLRLDPAMLGWLKDELFQKPLPKIILALGAATLAVEWRRDRKAPDPKWLWFLGAQFAMAVLMLRPSKEPRYAIYVAVLIVLFAMASILRHYCRHLERNRPRWVRSYGWVWIAPLFFLINTPVDVLWKVPRDFLFAPADKYIERFHTIYPAQRWANEKVRAEDRILWTAEKQHFYLDRPFESVVEMKKWEDILTPIQNPRQLFLVAKKLGYRYIHFSPQAGGYPIAIRPYWDKILALRGKAVVDASYSLIFDLNREI